jgi:LPXTG-motif cell wall-anchored protein
MRFGFRKRGIAMFVALAVMFLAGAAHAQSTTTTEKKSFEILSVRGNVLVIREASGTRELIVPPDFRFNVDGRNLAVGDLKAGMKGTATVTKTTISHPVYVTDVKDVTVVKTMGGSVIAQDANGDFRMYSQGDIDARGINVILEGKPVRFEDLQVGDRLTASIVTEGPPQKMSKTQVDVELAKAPAPGAAPGKVTTTQTTTSQTTSEVTVPDTTVEPVTEPIVPDTSTVPAAAPASSNSMWMWLGIIAVILIILLLLRRRSKR